MNKDTTLYIKWSKRENDLVYEYPNKTDARLLHRYMALPILNSDNTYGPSLFDELDRRGFDLTTLKFSIARKAEG